MTNAIEQFRGNLLRARELGNLGVAVAQLTTSAIDITDMWRAQIVLGVSALDHLIHELVRAGMIEIAKGIKPQTDSYLKFALPLDAVERVRLGHDIENWLGDAIQKRHSWQSFQQPIKIAEAIRLISAVSLWEEVGRRIGMNSKDVKVELEAIVDRRNKIAHEADMDPANLGFRWPISEVMAAHALNFIEKVAEAIVLVVR